MMDQLDLQIITALQISPRISWAKLGVILNVDSSTLSRRWQRLLAEGLVWTSCYFMPEQVNRNDTRIAAFVEIGCVPGQRNSVIEELVRLPQVIGVQCTSGARDLYATLRARTLLEIDNYVQKHIGVIPGVSSTRTHIVRKLFKEGSTWRLPVLSQAQIALLEAKKPDRAVPPTPSAEHLTVLTALQEDTRVPVSLLQQRLGTSLSSISRTVDTLLCAPWVKWRVDFAFTHAGWLCSAMLWMSVEQAQVTKVAAALMTFPQIRMCASTSGESNLVASMRLKHMEELDYIEAKLPAVFSGVQVRDRWIVPRIAKIQGHLLDPDGLHQEFVPLG